MKPRRKSGPKPIDAQDRRTLKFSQYFTPRQVSAFGGESKAVEHMEKAASVIRHAADKQAVNCAAIRNGENQQG